jgi:hypothetical protein
MTKENLMALARKTTLEPFYDFNDRTYKPAKTRRDVFLMLAGYNGRNGICPSYEMLKSDCCMSKRQVQRAIEWMADNHLLQIGYKASVYGTNLYTLIFPGEMSLSDVDKTGGDVDILKSDVDKTGGGRGQNRPPVIQSINRDYVLERERERTKPAHTLSDRTSGQVVIEIRKAGGIASRRDVESIASQMAESDWTDAEIRKATLKILGGLDEWQTKRAGEFVAVSLAAEIARGRQSTAEKARIEELSIQLDAKARAESLQLLASLEEPEVGL